MAGVTSRRGGKRPPRARESPGSEAQEGATNGLDSRWHEMDSPALGRFRHDNNPSPGVRGCARLCRCCGNRAELPQPADPLHRAVSSGRRRRHRRAHHRRQAGREARPADRDRQPPRRRRHARNRARRQSTPDGYTILVAPVSGLRSPRLTTASSTTISRAISRRSRKIGFGTVVIVVPAEPRLPIR